MTLVLLAQILFWLLVALLAVQAALAAGFIVVLLRRRHPLSDQECPKTAVVLCLRGVDPFLVECLEALLSQDYPNYVVHIVVDGEDDPAWSLAHETVERLGAENVRVQPLKERLATCSLKCSSVVQAVSGLDDTYQIVAQLDADAITHKTWLRELVAPLANDSVGAATGNRWYMPSQLGWGVLVRYLWNVAAVVQMYWYGVAWGGTLAIKMKVVRDANLLEKWSKAFCEDTMLFSTLKKNGLRVAFVPSLLLVNREGCTLQGYFHWARRQLLTARLYHPGWPLVVGHGFFTSVTPMLAIIALIIAWATWNSAAANWLLAGLLAYQMALVSIIGMLEWSVRRLVASRGEPTRWIGLVGGSMFVLAMIVTQVIYAAVLASTAVMRIVNWRGATYRIDGPWKIHLVEDQPYQSEPAARNQNSL